MAEEQEKVLGGAMKLVEAVINFKSTELIVNHMTDLMAVYPRVEDFETEFFAKSIDGMTEAMAVQVKDGNVTSNPQKLFAICLEASTKAADDIQTKIADIQTKIQEARQ